MIPLRRSPIKFLGLRVLHAILLLFSVSIFSFLLVRLAPGDYFLSMRTNPQISTSTITALRFEYGLNKGFVTLYWHWAESALKGDGGFSFAYNCAAASILWPRARNTLLLAATATLLAWLIALPAGVFAGARKKWWLDLLASGTIAVLLAVPELILGLILLLLAVQTGFPAGGMISVEALQRGFWGQLRDVLRHLFLPALCLAAGLLPLLLSHVRATMREALQSPFITAAHSLGIPFPRLLLRHALPAALNPLISLFGLSIGLLMSSSLVVESIFSWPGLGQLMLQAIADRDVFLIVDSAMLAACFLIAGNFIADVLLYFSDPRIRTE